MAKHSVLKATERDNTLNPRQLRAAGFVPVNLYGKGIHSVPLQVKAHELTVLLHHGSRTFQLEGFLDVIASLKQLQKDAVKQQVLGAELLLVEGSVPHSIGTESKSASQGKSAAKPEKAKAVAG